MLQAACLFLLLSLLVQGHKDLSWTGGPAHLCCDHGDILSVCGQHNRDNVIAVKAVSYNDNVFVLTPRIKSGVLSTVWLVTSSRKGVELKPYPDASDHALSDCDAVQNGVDFFLDEFGSIWILDTGIVETQRNPRCTCKPKVVVINLLRGKVLRRIDLQDIVQPSSLLQNIVVDYTLDGTFIYITDAYRGVILVYDVTKDGGWSVPVCAPAQALQMLIVKSGPVHSSLVLVRVPHAGIIELETSALHRNARSQQLIRAFGENDKPMLLLGSSKHHVYLRHTTTSEVLVWKTKNSFNYHQLEEIYLPSPHLATSSITAEPFHHKLVILDTSFTEAILENKPTYHRISFMDFV